LRRANPAGRAAPHDGQRRAHCRCCWLEWLAGLRGAQAAGPALMGQPGGDDGQEEELRSPPRVFRTIGASEQNKYTFAFAFVFVFTFAFVFAFALLYGARSQIDDANFADKI
jgi:hypothetical protein